MRLEESIKWDNKDSKLKVKKTKKIICTQEVMRLEVSIKSNNKDSKCKINKIKKIMCSKFKKGKKKVSCSKMLRHVHLYGMKKDSFQYCKR